MGFRFHRSFQLLPGVRINLSKTGLSLSLGGAPVTFNFGRRGGRVTTSLPGTGISYTQNSSETSRSSRGDLVERIRSWLSRFMS